MTLPAANAVNSATAPSCRTQPAASELRPRLGEVAPEIRVNGRVLRARNYRHFADVGPADSRAERRAARRTVLQGDVALPPGTTLAGLLTDARFDDGRDKVVIAMEDGSARIVWADEFVGFGRLARTAARDEPLNVTVDGQRGVVVALYDSKEAVPFKEIAANVGWVTLDTLAVGTCLGLTAVIAMTPGATGWAVYGWASGGGQFTGMLVTHSLKKIDFKEDRRQAKKALLTPPDAQHSLLRALAPRAAR